MFIKYYENTNYFETIGLKNALKLIKTNRHESAARDWDSDGKEAANIAGNPTRENDPQNQRCQVARNAAVK